MARLKTTNTPNLEVLLIPPSPMMLAVEQAILRGHKWSLAAAPVADKIAVRIAGAITMNLIHAGQRLLEADISEVLHVSRAPVREALRILERERMVEFEARRGAVVTAPEVDDLLHIYVVRDALYQILLQQLMDECPDELQAVFERHMPKIIKAADDSSVDDYTLQSFLLNLTMTELASNRLIVDLLTSISLRTLRYVRLGLAANPELMHSSQKTWRALQRAVERRDVAGVLDTARKRIEGSRNAAVRAIVPPDVPPRKAALASKPKPKPKSKESSPV
jgi:DNA-binding GntR family transcriptional regulator